VTTGPVVPRRSAVPVQRRRSAATALATAVAWQRRLPNVLTAMRVLMVPGGRSMGKHGKTQKRQLESLVIGPIGEILKKTGFVKPSNGHLCFFQWRFG